MLEPQIIGSLHHFLKQRHLRKNGKINCRNRVAKEETATFQHSLELTNAVDGLLHPFLCGEVVVGHRKVVVALLIKVLEKFFHWIFQVKLHPFYHFFVFLWEKLDFLAKLFPYAFQNLFLRIPFDFLRIEVERRN